MSSQRHYPRRGDIRKPYYPGTRGANAIGCRPNGGCPYCIKDRHYQQRRAKVYANMEINEFVYMPPRSQYEIKVRVESIAKATPKIVCVEDW